MALLNLFQQQKRGTLDEERLKQANDSLAKALRSNEDCTVFADTNLNVIAQKGSFYFLQYTISLILSNSA